MPRFAFFAPLLFAVGLSGCTQDVGSDDFDATDAASQTAIAKLLAKSKTEAFVNLPAKPSDEVVKAAKDAAGRGVRVYAWLREGGDYDLTLQRDFELGLGDVDVDVVAGDPQTGVLAESDGTALLAKGAKIETHTDAATVTPLRKRLAEAFLPPGGHGGSLIASGKLDVLPMPESGSGRILDVIAAASKTIDLEIYWLQDRQVIAALADARHRGVKVRVMLEPKVVGGGNYPNVSAELSAAGIDVKPTPPQFDTHGNVDHAKFSIIDGRELLMGSGNLMRPGLGENSDAKFGYRDFWVEDGRPKSVAEAQSIFDADWARTASAGSFTNLLATPDNAHDALRKLVDGAKKRVWVYNQSLNDADLIDRLGAAKKRGVDVQVLLGYQRIAGKPAPYNQPAVDALAKLGVKADLYKRHYLHGKAIVADDQVFIGSQNFTGGGLDKNRELGMIVTDAHVVGTLASLFSDDAAHPQ